MPLSNEQQAIVLSYIKLRALAPPTFKSKKPFDLLEVFKLQNLLLILAFEIVILVTKE